ncbi:MAG: 5,10-methylenetetrahydromethanopterin reductase [Candidatus Heimdallarchaeota archaeon LC_2]|nr:MAG: 5,10-methylenetetrahydromethanopterin reductase [Candidatus Heimdallarchaeota archaeon LC_2]
MDFGITFKGDISPARTRALCTQAEVAGFTYGWFFDSHVLWRDCYPNIAMCMEHTENMTFGPLVTNPGVREWSVAASKFAALLEQSGGRFEAAVGRGDSSRRVLGKKPMTVKNMGEYVDAIRALAKGDKVEYHGTEAQFPWAGDHTLKVWVAGYGPKALASAGVHGDGLVIQLADPGLIKWFNKQAVDAGEKAGKDMTDFSLMAAAPVWVGDMDKAREQTRWFPAMVGNHVADIVERHGIKSDDIPHYFTEYVKGRKGYDYKEHADKDADHLDFISNDVIDAFGILGSVDDHIKKLKELEKVGVTQFNIYLMCGEEERIVAEYGEHIIPEFQ